MSDVKITALPSLSTQPVSADLLPLVENSSTTTKRVTFGTLLGTELSGLNTLSANGIVNRTGAGTYTAVNFSDKETPSGTINGANLTFTLAHTVSPAVSLILVLNGSVQSPAGTDYTLSGLTVTFVTAPPTGSILVAWYRY